ncbi:unnamed protein product [Cylindrotheca closterium]|uniref:Uncharacterized protein n=1 Tax=Cylindrotheca closterium TaxID=2856 RepID=A0AAD2FM07_9STRA|nr:unnamed protein product [Cylindrotheca closterium]
MSGPFGQGKVVSTIIVVPTADGYGATNLALCSTCGGGEESEVMASHADLALGAQGNRLLRKKKQKGELSEQLLTSISQGYQEAFDRNSEATMAAKAT